MCVQLSGYILTTTQLTGHSRQGRSSYAPFTAPVRTKVIVYNLLQFLSSRRACRVPFLIGLPHLFVRVLIWLVNLCHRLHNVCFIPELVIDRPQCCNRAIAAHYYYSISCRRLSVLIISLSIYVYPQLSIRRLSRASLNLNKRQ